MAAIKVEVSLPFTTISKLSAIKKTLSAVAGLSNPGAPVIARCGGHRSHSLGSQAGMRRPTPGNQNSSDIHRLILEQAANNVVIHGG
jgi:hypothetical protein